MATVLDRWGTARRPGVDRAPVRTQIREYAAEVGEVVAQLDDGARSAASRLVDWNYVARAPDRSRLGVSARRLPDMSNFYCHSDRRSNAENRQR